MEKWRERAKTLRIELYGTNPSTKYVSTSYSQDKKTFSNVGITATMMLYTWIGTIQSTDP